MAARRPTLMLLLSLLSGLSTVLDARLDAAPGPATGPMPAPSTRLAGATRARARALALDSALLRGWELAESRADYVRFETRLDAPTSSGPPDAQPREPVLLRIHAHFRDAPEGALVTLGAEEVWRAGTAQDWSSDITTTYRRHLERALASLQAQWRQYASAQPARHQDRLNRRQAHPDADADAEVRPLDPNTLQLLLGGQTASARDQSWAATADLAQPVGVWAFEAEKLAQALGCTLTDRGAVLASTNGDVETHRIECSNRSAIQVRCNRQRCSR